MDDKPLAKPLNASYEFSCKKLDYERIYSIYQILLPVSEISEIINKELQEQSRGKKMDSI